MLIQTYGKPIMELKKKKNSLASVTDVEKTCFLNLKLKLLMNIFLIFLGFMNTFSDRICSSK